MAQDFQWDSRLFSYDTSEFDRALAHLRRMPADTALSPSVLSIFPTKLKENQRITRREFDRRFRLVVLLVIEQNRIDVADVLTSLSEAAPEALNALRTLLPAELRHRAVQNRQMVESPREAHSNEATTVRRIADKEVPPPTDTSEQPPDSRFNAVVLIGTSDEHVRNDALIRDAGLNALRLVSLDEFWDIAPTGLCGVVVGASAWAPFAEAEQRRAIRRICEYSTFIFTRICLDGMATGIAQSFSEYAAGVRRGTLDGRKFCHGQDCELTLADIQVLRSIAQLFEKAGQADFYPLGLSEPDASLLRLIAIGRHRSGEPLTIHKLGTRELAGGNSAARVFLLSDGQAHPFVAKVHDAEELCEELDRYRKWIENWERHITDPVFYAHQGSAALSFRLQAAPDGNNQPAPTLEECLEGLRSAEWNRNIPPNVAQQKASDIFDGISRAADHLVTLNSRFSHVSDGDEFYLSWPVEELAARGIDPTIIGSDGQPLQLSTLVEQAMSRLHPSLGRGVVHGDVHGRNILLIDRLPTFIDFRLSGPGHPLSDLVRLDAAVRTIAMRMICPKQEMFQVFKAIYLEGQPAENVLGNHSALAASPLACLALRVAAKTRQASLNVARSHSLAEAEFYAMTCVVSAHVLSARAVGSGIERLLLTVMARQL